VLNRDRKTLYYELKETCYTYSCSHGDEFVFFKFKDLWDIVFVSI